MWMEQGPISMLRVLRRKKNPIKFSLAVTQPGDQNKFYLCKNPYGAHRNPITASEKRD